MVWSIAVQIDYISMQSALPWSFCLSLMHSASLVWHKAPATQATINYHSFHPTSVHTAHLLPKRDTHRKSGRYGQLSSEEKINDYNAVEYKQTCPK